MFAASVNMFMCLYLSSCLCLVQYITCLLHVRVLVCQSGAVYRSSSNYTYTLCKLFCYHETTICFITLFKVTEQSLSSVPGSMYDDGK